VNIRVILADDHPFALLGIRSALECVPDIRVVGAASSPSTLLEMLRVTPCEVLVTDLAMPDTGQVGADGPPLVRRLRREWPQLGVVVWTGLTHGAVLHAIVADPAVGVVNKADSMKEVAVAVRAAAEGRAHIGQSIARALSEAAVFRPRAALSPHESDIVRLITSGHSIDEIARMLQLDVRTVRRRKRSAMAKLGVRTIPGLFACAHALGVA
jgi:two-component system, NarL family, captular synthesis response regulator RcsB